MVLMAMMRCHCHGSIDQDQTSWLTQVLVLKARGYRILGQGTLDEHAAHRHSCCCPRPNPACALMLAGCAEGLHPEL